MDFASHFPVLLNLLGHTAGITAFGAFLILLARSPRRDIRVPAAAAALALCWNLGSLTVLLADPGGQFQASVSALSLAFLSLVPCTLLHLALGGEHRWLSTAGYAVGAVAATVHLSNAVGVPVATAGTGIASINYGFGSLSIIGAVLLARGGSRQTHPVMRTLAAMALFLLALSFVHFGRAHEPGAWLHELVFHHAGIPLALFVLIQDYRFLLMDVYVRLAGSLLLAAAFAGTILWAADLLGLVEAANETALDVAAFLVTSVLAILVYPAIVRRLSAWAENSLFGRKDMRAVADAISTIPTDDESLFLSRASRCIAEFASAEHWKLIPAGAEVRITKAETIPSPSMEALHANGNGWSEAVVPLRDGVGAQHFLLLGAREGGRRYLSVNLTDLDLLASEVAGRVEAMRREEQDSLLRNAEIATLRAQINPHFLFNALNALNAIIPAKATDARRTLLSLADIFRYSLNSKQHLVSLSDEMEIVEAYLQIERLRLGDRLMTRIEIDKRVRFSRVPALSIQPLVENAIKHGVSRKVEGGEVRVEARAQEGGLRVEVTDNGPGFDTQAQRDHGHGLRSVERRLQLCYEGTVQFAIESDPSGTCVRFTVPAAAERTIDTKHRRVSDSEPHSQARRNIDPGTMRN